MNKALNEYIALCFIDGCIVFCSLCDCIVHLLVAMCDDKQEHKEGQQALIQELYEITLIDMYGELVTPAKY